MPFIDGGGYTSHPLRADDVVITNPDPTVNDEAPTPPAILLGTRFRGAYWDPAYNDFGRDGNVYWYGSVGFEYVINPDAIRARRD